MTNNRDPFNYTANLILRAKPDFEYAREPLLRRMPNGDLVCVKREVIRIVTPGTNFNPSALEEGKNNYIMCVVYMSNMLGISVSDITTGEYLVTEVRSARELFDEIPVRQPTSATTHIRWDLYTMV